MFDLLTTDQMYDLHTSLSQSASKIHNRMLSYSVFSDDWRIAAAAHDELTDTMFAITREIGEREASHV